MCAGKKRNKAQQQQLQENRLLSNRFDSKYYQPLEEVDVVFEYFVENQKIKNSYA